MRTARHAEDNTRLLYDDCNGPGTLSSPVLNRGDAFQLRCNVNTDDNTGGRVRGVDATHGTARNFALVGGSECAIVPAAAGFTAGRASTRHSYRRHGAARSIRLLPLSMVSARYLMWSES